MGGPSPGYALSRVLRTTRTQQSLALYRALAVARPRALASPSGTQLPRVQPLRRQPLRVKRRKSEENQQWRGAA